MEKELKCLRCGCDMKYMSCEYMRLGPQSILEKGLEALITDTLKVDIYACPQCQKLEFFSPEPIFIPSAANDPDAVTCPGCNQRHEYGRTSCPYCGRKYLSCPKCGRIHDMYVSFCPQCRHEYKKGKKQKPIGEL